MSAARASAIETRRIRLAPYLLSVARRGDLQYLRQPAPGQFAVLDVEQGEKAFFQIPRSVDLEGMRDLIESHFGSAAERVAEFVWAI